MGRKPVRPGRATIAVALGTIGLFVISMAAGLGTEAGGWPFGAVGAALVIIAVALLTTASMRGADRTFVAGTVHVQKVSSQPLSNVEFGRCEMTVLVDAPGLPGETVVVRDPRVPVAKWPQVGEPLPALIAVSDVRRIKIQWDRVGFSAPYGDESYEDESDHNDPYESPYIDDPEELYLHQRDRYDDDDDDYGGRSRYQERPYAPDDVDVDDWGVPAAIDPLPRRRPSPGPLAETHSVAVLEGEVIPAEVPAPRGGTVDVLDFSDVPEPEKPTPPPPVFGAEEQVLPTQPAARPASAGSIHGVGITVIVSDLQRSQRFYHDMLGFYEIDSGPDSVILASGDTRIVLMAAHESAPVNRRLVHLNLEVGDVEAVYRELKLRGVSFIYGPRVVNRGERLELIAASFKDPDGHGIAITQWKARTD
ncbi:VOC family protein [Allorhizocola rhizosphaerae]|uniref:VOC family protein n=1 Tax=Allorhizocola rhizosphaerae TaxID=1872709 RepID=UPI0013C2FCCE|nr:VOC family protein [Allorhizocola rhizosphaerae]